MKIYLVLRASISLAKTLRCGKDQVMTVSVDIVLGWFISGLGRETEPSGASEGTMAIEHLRTEGKVNIRSDMQK